MIDEQKLKKRLYKHDNGMEKCTLCNESIPKEVHRISWSVQARLSMRYVRLCALCIQRLNKYIDNNEIDKWNKKLLLKEI